MVAVRSPVDELPDSLYVDGVGRMVASGLRYWAEDAGRYLRGPEAASGRQEAAWSLIEGRPPGCPLVVLASSLTGMSEVQVWRHLCHTAMGIAGLPTHL